MRFTLALAEILDATTCEDCGSIEADPGVECRDGSHLCMGCYLRRSEATAGAWFESELAEHLVGDVLTPEEPLLPRSYDTVAGTLSALSLAGMVLGSCVFSGVAWGLWAWWINQ